MRTPHLAATADAVDSRCSTGKCCITIAGDFDGCCTEASMLCGSPHGEESVRLETKKRLTFRGSRETGGSQHADLPREITGSQLVGEEEKQVGSWLAP